MVIAAVAQGAKIKVVGVVFDNTPLNIWTRKDTGIAKPKDLEGKTLGAPPGDAQRMLFPAFARLNGVDESKVTWLNIEPAAKFVALSEKRVDAVADYTTGLPFWEKAIGKDNPHDAVAPVRLRHVLDVDLRQREDDERARRRC